jgi:glucose 1-dehydrogenase
LTGVPSLKGPYEIEGDFLMRNIVLKNQVIFGSVNASLQNFGEAVRDIGRFKKKWPGRMESLIGERVPVDQAVEALQRGSKGIKTIVTFN